MSIQKEEISVSSASTVQKVVSYIEQRICAQELCPGDRIPTENELCALLGVSRTSVREAIKILESMTIIQVRRGDGTYIARPQDITFYTPWKFKMLLEGTTWQEVLAFREQMEFSILRCAFLHITEQDLSTLSQNLEKTRWICQYEPGNMQALIQLDDEFHGTIAHATQNKMLEDMELDHSILAAVGNAVAWIFIPLGWGEWKSTVAAITGLVAKENVVNLPWWQA